MKKTQSGFTLIEVMIVVVVIGILASIALPAYDEQVRRGRRAEAQTQLLMAAQFLERTYTTTGSYGGTLPTGLSQSPPTGTAYYTIAYVTTNAANTAFRMTATNTGAMAADKCGSFVLDSTGAKSITGGTVAADQCWRR